MNPNNPPRRISSTIINALGGGVVPRVGLEYIAVGRDKEIDALLHDVDTIASGGAAFRFIVGRYGSGKSFLLQTIRNYATEKGFVVVDADLSPERRFVGSKGQGLATYKELMQNMSTKTKPDGGALPLILERWLSRIKMEVADAGGVGEEGPAFDALVEKRVRQVVGSLEGMVNGFEFAKAVLLYYQAYNAGDDEGKSRVIRWFRGEYGTMTEAKNELGIRLIVTDDNWYDFLKIFASFLVHAGYQGLLVIVDELVNLYKIPQAVTRQSNYERLCHNKQLINSHFYRGVSELPYKLLFAVIYTHLEFRYEMSHTITSHHVHHFHQTRIPDGTLLDYMVQYRKPLFPQFFLYPKKFLPENNPHHKEFHLRPYIQNNANQ